MIGVLFEGGGGIVNVGGKGGEFNRGLRRWTRIGEEDVMKMPFLSIFSLTLDFLRIA
jgi:hypothetical protein